MSSEVEDSGWGGGGTLLTKVGGPFCDLGKTGSSWTVSLELRGQVGPGKKADPGF
jgi:hypothetical protein